MFTRGYAKHPCIQVLQTNVVAVGHIQRYPLHSHFVKRVVEALLHSHHQKRLHCIAQSFR